MRCLKKLYTHTELNVKISENCSRLLAVVTVIFLCCLEIDKYFTYMCTHTLTYTYLSIFFDLKTRIKDLKQICGRIDFVELQNIQLQKHRKYLSMTAVSAALSLIWKNHLV